jgi:GT2 family glycosyltransferase
LVDRYFAAGPPARSVAVLAGEILDKEPPRGCRHGAARYAFLRRSMAQRNTRAALGPFAKTANAAVRRAPFEAIGGFRENLLAGEDVDLCYRLRNAGWQLEYRDDAFVEHRGRNTVRELVRQHMGHGAGTAWLDTEYPGFGPPVRWASLVVSMVRGTLKSGWAVMHRDYDRALIEFLDPVTALSFHLGRLRSALAHDGKARK